MEKISSFGFLLSDHLPGPYNLEVDWIKASNMDFQPESPDMLVHLVDPDKQRVDWVDSMGNSFGFGFDMAPVRLSLWLLNVREWSRRQSHVSGCCGGTRYLEKCLIRNG
jgi:hypothetical protein